jgi:hypothetical protein
VVVHFTYHSQTQQTLHVTPFLWLMCASGWSIYRAGETTDLAGIGALLAFVWLFLANFLMNALVAYRGPRLGPIDLSKNSSPTSAEKLLNGSFLAFSIAVGALTAATSVQDIMPRLELKILVGGIVLLVVTGLIHGALTLAVIVLSGFRIRPVRG